MKTNLAKKGVYTAIFTGLGTMSQEMGQGCVAELA
jgi:hypothetical protein